VIYSDKGFSISEYTFYEYDEVISEREEKIKNIEKLFTKFKEAQTDNIINSKSIFDFLWGFGGRSHQVILSLAVKTRRF